MTATQAKIKLQATIDQFNRCSGKVARFRKVRILARALRIV